MANRSSLTAGTIVAATGAIILGVLAGACLPAGTDSASAPANRQVSKRSGASHIPAAGHHGPTAEIPLAP